MGTRFGYVRCSTNEFRQDIERQVRELQQMGVDRKNIFREYESGSKINRVELDRLLASVRPGDEVYATEVSRITRSTKQLCDIIERAQERRLKLVVGSFVVDCTGEELDPMTDGMLKMMGVFAEMERNMIRQRVKSGIANARSKGKCVGRPRLTLKDIPAKVMTTYGMYTDGTISKVDFAKICGISRPTLDKYLSVMVGG